MEKNEAQHSKTQVFNVIILDKSGSMIGIREAAIDGFNETLSGIKTAQQKYADTQEHFVSLLTFCLCETKFVFDKVPVAEARPLTMEDYVPCCCTPLYDAIGFTLTSMRQYTQQIEDAVVVVTIITDGIENMSAKYTGTAIKTMINELRGEGWTFTYMGANQDAVEVADNLSIRNSRNFCATKQGTKDAMAKDANTRMNFFGRIHSYYIAKPISRESKNILKTHYVAMADEAFDEEEGK